ncbi:MAG: carbohydrate kinase [Clostridiales bacterium]|nr:carbohydrate kinase [Clostridiales bacterium]
MKYITAIGEALIDFIPEEKGCRLKDVTGFKRVCGGAPANVAAAAALLGGKSRIITKLGKDPFGDYIVDTLNQAGVDTGSVLRTDEAKTALAFVALANDGNRDFSFYRNPSADMLLKAEEISEDILKGTGILHFCSVDLIKAPVKYAHIKAIELAKSQNAIISFDPNIRLNLWDSPENCVSTIRDFIKYADILKISDEELELITGENDIKKAAPSLFSQGVKMIMYTMGGDGAALLTPGKEIKVKAPKVTAKDTTGAGDCIIGSFLYALSAADVKKETLPTLSEKELHEMLYFANCASALSVTKSGAIASYSTLPEIKKFMKNL